MANLAMQFDKRKNYTALMCARCAQTLGKHRVMSLECPLEGGDWHNTLAFVEAGYQPELSQTAVVKKPLLDNGIGYGSGKQRIDWPATEKLRAGQAPAAAAAASQPLQQVERRQTPLPKPVPGISRREQLDRLFPTTAEDPGLLDPPDQPQGPLSRSNDGVDAWGRPATLWGA